MLTSIEVQGFKSFSKKSLELRQLTLLCGLNNSGKSSVIQAIRMFCNSCDRNAPLLTGHGSVDELRSRLVNPTDPIVIRCTFDASDVEELTLTDTNFEKPKKAPLTCYVSADRWGPKILLPLDRRLSEFPAIGDHGEYVIGFLDALRNLLVPEALHHPKSQGDTLEYQMNGWLEEIAPGVKIVYEVDSKRDSAHIEYDTYRSANVGFGLSYCLPMLAAILGMSALKPSSGWDTKWGKQWEEQKKQRGMLVMIENPEAHLHPKGQTALGKLIALGAKSGIQIIVETQSDHLMDGIRIAVKQGLLGHDMAIFHYLTRGKEGETTIETPELTSEGKLSFWPNGFFDQTLKNRSELSR